MNIKQRVEKISKLNKARTQGDWEWLEDRMWGGYSGLYAADEEVCVPNASNDGDEGHAWFEDYLTDDNKDFIAHAPEMAHLISDLYTELEKRDKRIEELEEELRDMYCEKSINQTEEV